MGGGPWDWLTTGCFGVFRCRLGCLVGGLIAFEFFMACYPLERDILSRNRVVSHDFPKSHPKAHFDSVWNLDLCTWLSGD